MRPVATVTVAAWLYLLPGVVVDMV